MRYTRPAIEAHQMNLSERSPLGLLIDVTRDTLFATELAEWRKSAVAGLIQSPWPTERRIAIAHCFLRRQDLPEHEASIISYANLADPDLFHELAKLIAASVEDLSKSSVQIIVDFMRSLHVSPSDGERILYQRWAAILPADLLPAPDSESRLFGDFYDTRLSRLMPALSARERAALTVRAFKNDEPEDPDWMPRDQADEFRRLIGLENTVALQFSSLIASLKKDVEKMALKVTLIKELCNWDYNVIEIEEAATLVLQGVAPEAPGVAELRLRLAKPYRAETCFSQPPKRTAGAGPRRRTSGQ